MCPMRFLLVFFSAVLAGYFAWKTVSSSPEFDSPDELNEKQELNLKKKMENGFWVFVDMASGRYLWRNLKEMREKSQ
ncbi:unnamed protein product [Arabidopsis thaliana]|uniref:Emb/CAB87627.1 n=4 Tax=Arabidopsis TaxID=3701 RepID=Q9FK55_ARATH|nr:Methyltransferase-related protein [Arabidopsis thaliana]KAG7602664.1 hypothetical protein ISN45_At05g017080 [Arabidopsis thaliana x Arabidopsis arenosa]KAG7609599.1 hypothetical protein ISN44_As05g016950 [Arabidopsis suecica]AAO64067.1 unknown protein [Arabidopsis thaliana]AED92513.1 Methyltransferase-related protein [Arabidopsis thaliana]OAO90397.1 hypothetical protein AXX17_AT5G17910 [Arabidopsis thaliana]|eukprot:NP_197316.1 Methyltransferase-related protein [Arabidopsis thaliana]